MTADPTDGQMRLDLWLWRARFFKSRSLAAQHCRNRRVRIDGKVQSKASAAVAPGNVLTFPKAGRVVVVEVRGLPHRRGPASEAREAYDDLTPKDEPDESVSKSPAKRRGPRPTKRARRRMDCVRSGSARS